MGARPGLIEPTCEAPIGLVDIVIYTLNLLLTFWSYRIIVLYAYDFGRQVYVFLNRNWLVKFLQFLMIFNQYQFYLQQLGGLTFQ